MKLLAVILSSLVLVACGGGGGGASTPPSSGQWLKLQNGDPGIPGDGISVPQPSLYASNQLVPHLPLTNFSTGITVAVFSTTPPDRIDFEMAPNPSGPTSGCLQSVGLAFTPVQGDTSDQVPKPITYNGVAGIYVSLTAAEVQYRMVSFNPCGTTLDQLEIATITAGASNNLTATVDAIWVAPGYNALPH